MVEDDAAKFDLLCSLADNSVDFDSIIKYSEQAIALAEKLDISPADAYNCMGFGNLNSGKLAAALECFMKSADYYKSESDYIGLATTYTYISEVYNVQDNYDNAKYYLKNAVEIFSKENDTIMLAYTLANLGYINYSMEQYDTALVIYSETSEIFQNLAYQNEYGFSLGNSGLAYSRLSEYQKAEDYLLRAIEILTEQADIGYEIAVTEYMIEYAYILQHKGEIEKAIAFATESFGMASKNDILEFERDAAYRLASLFQISGKFDSAYHYQSIYINANDSINSVENIQNMADLRTEFEVAKKQAEVEVLEKNKLIQIIVILGLGLILLLAIGLILMYSYNLKRSKKLSSALDERRILMEKQGKELKVQHEELKQQNDNLASQKDEILAQRDEIEAQRDLVTDQKDQIIEQKQATTDSIIYARRIQTAILPPDEVRKYLLPKHFILYKPRDIVSGDFYWLTQKREKIIIVVADCTGHGVPGAFMSMLGSALLNDIVNNIEILEAGLILDELRDQVMESLRQTGQIDEAKDGMDIALCILDKKNKTLQYAGGYNPLYLIRKNELIEIKADKMPIGISSKAGESFTNHELNLQKGDAFYMFSDGYIDQFGGPKGKKFMTSRFKQLLLDIQNKIMFEQKEILEQTLDDWMGNTDLHGENYEQIDDIIVMGIKI